MIQSKLELGDVTSKHRLPIACAEMPQARFDAFGVQALSDTELLALMLHSGVTGQPVLTLATRLMTEAGSLAALARWSAEDFRRLKGVGRTKAQQLVAMLEIGRRAMRAQEPAPMLNKPELIYEHMLPEIQGLAVEKFYVLCLNRKNRLLKQVEVTTGTATSSLAHPREVFREAIRHGATAVVCVHNHPSGDPGPSGADVQVTRCLRDASKAVDIELLDHVIVGLREADPQGLGFYSFRQAGVL
jgi:DNA repair protein RadC